MAWHYAFNGFVNDLNLSNSLAILDENVVLEKYVKLCLSTNITLEMCCFMLQTVEKMSEHAVSARENLNQFCIGLHKHTDTKVGLNQLCVRLYIHINI